MKKYLKPTLKFIGVFAIFFVIIFSLLNIGAIIPRIRFYAKYLTNKQSSSQFSETQIEPVQNQDQNQSTNNNSTTQNYAENHLIIPKLNMDVPIIWNVSDKDLMDQLLHGVVHYNGTALPDQDGNIFIMGHSSYYWLGPYSSIFSMIDKLNPGDQVGIMYQEHFYIYTVENKMVVKPDRVDLMKNSDRNMLTLMTCVPIGTAWNRLIIQANLTSII